MKNFLLGCLFILIILPIIDNLIALMSNQIQYLQCKIQKKIYDIKKQINLQQQEEDNKNQIGFQSSCIGYEIQNPGIQDDQDE